MRNILTMMAIVFYFVMTGQLYAQSNADGGGAFASGKYRNLFKEGGHSDKKIKEKIEAAYQQLFYGDTTTQAIYFPAGKNERGALAYISDVLHNDIRSEGMSYGMMIAVQLNKKADFDALWNYAMSYMYISSKDHPSEGYFSWSLKRNGQPNEETPAPDGEEYFVTALYFASGRWGNGKGIYNYHEWANRILSTMRHHPPKTGMTKFGQRSIGSMMNEDHKMIRFVPGIGRNNFTDPSYHLPHFYELWSRWGPVEDRSFWQAAADSSRIFFVKSTNKITGLAPDYANFDGSPRSTRNGGHSQDFSYDAWRTAGNWSVDWAWFRKAPQAQVLSDRIQAFFAAQGLDKYGCQYTLDGQTLINSRHASGLVATNAVASLAATKPLARNFVDALWNTPVPQSLGERYYDGLLYLMGLMHCGGKYRIYPPR